MKCPVCGAVYRPAMGSGVCKRCKADLSDLIRLHDQAIWYHSQALYLLLEGDYPQAEANNNQALGLYYSHPDFHALAGKLSALQGNFHQAIAFWQQALKFDPENAIASAGLEMIAMLQAHQNSSAFIEVRHDPHDPSQTTIYDL